MELKIDPKRVATIMGDTGIFVRAQDEEGKWQSVDIIFLTPDSLTEWMRSRGGENEYAENLVRHLLAFDQVVKP